MIHYIITIDPDTKYDILHKKMQYIKLYNTNTIYGPSPAYELSATKQNYSLTIPDDNIHTATAYIKSQIKAAWPNFKGKITIIAKPAKDNPC